jgi:hypothetical protein
MKRISGLVLVKESGVGIPNLVVAVFDSDLTIEDIRKQEPSATLLRRAGKRISSVLTDAAGRFSLSTENLEFPGNEARPDLLLMVLAPEDVQDMQRPYPLPVDERTLYMSTVPRIDAGAEEAYVIRLLQAQIDRFQLFKSGGDASNAVRELTDSRLRALGIRQGVTAALAEPAAAERRRTDEARAEAKKKVERLSAIPLHLRNDALRSGALFIQDKSELRQKLPAMQKEAVTSALERMAKDKSRPSMRLYLREEEMRELGLKIAGDRVSGEVSAAALSKQIHSLIDVTDLIRRRDPAPTPLEELERKYLSGTDTTPTPPKPR